MLKKKKVITNISSMGPLKITLKVIKSYGWQSMVGRFSISLLKIDLPTVINNESAYIELMNIHVDFQLQFTGIITSY